MPILIGKDNDSFTKTTQKTLKTYKQTQIIKKKLYFCRKDSNN